SRTGRVVVGDDGVEHPPAGGAGGLKSGPRRVCPSSTHGVDRLDDHPNLDFGAQHARYGFGVQPKSDRLLGSGVRCLIAPPLGMAFERQLDELAYQLRE
ncbi:MAG: hypothetical protein ACREYE_02090, partial [Gammaproteobacteria bacterium]